MSQSIWLWWVHTSGISFSFVLAYYYPVIIRNWPFKYHRLFKSVACILSLLKSSLVSLSINYSFVKYTIITIASNKQIKIVATYFKNLALWLQKFSKSKTLKYSIIFFVSLFLFYLSFPPHIFTSYLDWQYFLTCSISLQSV